MKKVCTGCEIINKILEGGYETDIITTIYGPAGSGKTCLCLLAAQSIAQQGKKVIYIDTEGGFSVARFRQIADEKHLENILFYKPTSFEEQKKSFEEIKEIINDKIGLIVVDTIAMLYRLELGKTEDVYDTNRELGKQIAFLNEIARKMNIPVLITNQIYSSFDERNKVCMVGGDLLKYGSKCLIELQSIDNKRKLILRKHRSIPEEKKAFFKIIDKGITGIE
ncbi:DNA repair and recombination protein RadB [Candidatus Woesearchaeota archaeon]|nr:DNA repair and recombination protein RadB [Candidatus Woesearchaeota archaeon]